MRRSTLVAAQRTSKSEVLSLFGLRHPATLTAARLQIAPEPGHTTHVGHRMDKTPRLILPHTTIEAQLGACGGQVLHQSLIDGFARTRRREMQRDLGR